MTRQQKITLGEMRASGVRDLRVYCADYRCAHAVRISADRWPDHVRLSDRFGAAQEWQAAMEALILVATSGGPTMYAAAAAMNPTRANINETALFHLSLSDGFSVWAIFIIAGGGFGAPWKREFRAGWTDKRLPRGGHDLPAFQRQTPTAFDSGFAHAICEGPRVYDPPRVRASRDRACRQSRDPHQRHGRDGGAADRSKQTVLIPRRQCPRTAPSRVRRRGKDFRRIATRYDRLARNYLASVCLAAAPLYGGFNESGP